MAQTGIGVVSCAHVHTPGYLREVASAADAALIAIWDEDPARGQEQAARYEAEFVPRLEALLDKEEVAGVIVCSPTAFHAEHIEAAAAAGKHIFCEKPLTVTKAQGLRCAEAAQKAGVLFQMCFPSRTRGESIWVKQVLDEALIGKVTTARARIAHSAALDGWFANDNWFVDKSRAGGGGFMDLGVHRMDLLRWLLGPARSVVAKLVNATGRYDLDDNGVAVIEFESGALGILDAGWAHRAGDNPLEIYGSEGALSVTRHGVWLQSSKLEWQGMRGALQPELPPSDPGPLRQFLDRFQDGQEPSITAQDGINASELMEACYRSAESGQAVSLPL